MGRNDDLSYIDIIEGGKILVTTENDGVLELTLMKVLVTKFHDVPVFVPLQSPRYQ